MAHRRTRTHADLTATTGAAREPLARPAPSAAAPSAPGLRSLQGLVGNRTIARLLGQGTSGAQQRPAQAGPPREGHVQRVLALNGQRLDTAVPLEAADDVNARVIIANWGWSSTTHDFVGASDQAAYDRLWAAVDAAKTQVVDPPGLYSAANLAFLTAAADRLPTLYFIAGSTSGRIRQQHGAGPAVISQSDKVDYFFSTRGDLDRFQAAARTARDAGDDFQPDLSAFNATTTPTANYFHYEVTYSGAKVAKLHPSGGTVDTNIGAYDDVRVKAAYQKAIGART